MPIYALRWQPTTEPGTVTDPVWADLVVAFLAVLTLLTVCVILDSIFRTLRRRAQQNRAMREWRRDVDARQATWDRTGLL